MRDNDNTPVYIIITIIVIVQIANKDLFKCKSGNICTVLGHNHQSHNCYIVVTPLSQCADA